MAYNHGREDRKWRIWKEAEEKLLRECGVDEATIEQIRMADRADFNSNRRFYRWTNDVAEYLEDMAGRERQAEVGTVAELLEEIESENLYQLFVGMEDLQKKGITVTADQYRCVYSSLYLPNEDMNAIYSIFNDDPPADYKAHSLSVSDVVIMNQNGDMKAFFVDRFGFQELPDFVEERKKILGMESDIQKKDMLEQTSCISFYAAECSEFPVLGEVHHDLTLPEALEAYEKIPAERMNGIKSVGFNLQEGSDYDGMMDLMVGGRSQREILDSIPFYKENKLVQTALKCVEQYIEEKSLNAEKTEPKEEKSQVQKTKSQKRREEMSL